MRKYNKAHRDWANAVKLRDGNKCVICGNTKNLNAHHLIPWEIEKFRFDVNNGISLCPSHHTRYSFHLSPHSDGSALFFFWLFENKPETYKWLKENFTNEAQITL